MGDHIIDLVGRLRVYAAVLAGSMELGDCYVATCLEALVADVDEPSDSDEFELRISAFQVLSRIVGSVPPSTERWAIDPPPDDLVIADVRELPWRERQALLLMVLVEFSAADTARVLETTTGEVRALYRNAIWRVAERFVKRREASAGTTEGLRIPGQFVDLEGQTQRHRPGSSPPPSGSSGGLH